MAKIKTNENSFACSYLGEFTDWDYNSKYGYSKGICVTRLGIIELYYQFKSEDFDVENYATARVIHNRRIYDLRTNDKITSLGWTRIAKKWAKNIWQNK